MESELSLQTRREFQKPNDPTVSQGNDRQEEEQAARCLHNNDRLQSQIPDVAPQPCASGATRPSAPSPTPERSRRSNTHCSWSGMPPTASAPNASCPFSPRLSKRFTRHGYLHLTEECRRQLLSMSAATADRLLRFQRKLAKRGLSTTRAGTLLKQLIPIRTFEEWNETRLGLTSSGTGAPIGYSHKD